MPEEPNLYLPGPLVGQRADFRVGSQWPLAMEDVGPDHVTSPLLRFAVRALRPADWAAGDLSDGELRELLALGQPPVVNDHSNRRLALAAADYFATLPSQYAADRAEALRQVADATRIPRVMAVEPSQAGALTLGSAPVGATPSHITVYVCPASMQIEDELDAFDTLVARHGGPDRAVVVTQARPGECSWSIHVAPWSDVVRARTNEPHHPAADDVAQFRAYRFGIDRGIGELLTAVRMEAAPGATMEVVLGDADNERFLRDATMSAVSAGNQLVLPPWLPHLLARTRAGFDISAETLTDEHRRGLEQVVAKLGDPDAPRPGVDAPSPDGPPPERPARWIPQGAFSVGGPRIRPRQLN